MTHYLLKRLLMMIPLFIGITLMDAVACQPDRIPDYAPLLER